jgi:hypothetical protein
MDEDEIVLDQHGDRIYPDNVILLAEQIDGEQKLVAYTARLDDKGMWAELRDTRFPLTKVAQTIRLGVIPKEKLTILYQD